MNLEGELLCCPGKITAALRLAEHVRLPSQAPAKLLWLYLPVFRK